MWSPGNGADRLKQPNLTSFQRFEPHPPTLHELSGLGNQLAGLMQPAADIASGESPAESVPPLTIDHSASDKSRGKKRRKRNTASTLSGETATIEWQHDAAKYGNPQQSWNTAKKAIWTLYVISKEAGHSQLTAPQIADTFNRKFKQSGVIRPNNVSRDLGSAKLKTPPLIGEDTAKPVAEWFLTDAGINFALDAIKEVVSYNASN